jgi:nucleoid DNA-binding protein
MNNKDFISELGKKLSLPIDKTEKLMQIIVDELHNQLSNGNKVRFFDLGEFSLRLQEQKYFTNPKSKKKFVLPPKMQVKFNAASKYFNSLKSAENE